MRRPVAAAALALLSLAALAPAALRAEPAWIRGAALNLRAGAGPDREVLAALQPGEQVELLESQGEWAKVRRSDGVAGWVAKAYLVQDAPPSERIAQLEAQAADLRRQLEAAGRDVEAARRSAEERERERAAHADQVASIQRENDALRAGARWPEWITGALILSTGMALGAAVRGVAASRRQSRLRL